MNVQHYKDNKNSLKGYSHNRNFSYQYSHPLKNSSQFSQHMPKNVFHKQSMGDSTHQSYASIQSSSTFTGTARTNQMNSFKQKHRIKRHKKNLSSNFGHSPFLKKPK